MSQEREGIGRAEMDTDLTDWGFDASIDSAPIASASVAPYSRTPSRKSSEESVTATVRSMMNGFMDDNRKLIHRAVAEAIGSTSTDRPSGPDRSQLTRFVESEYPEMGGEMKARMMDFSQVSGPTRDGGNGLTDLS